jgi:aspartyl-tRNA(Asn)/glutamyl-tRNA(Gln) amidotransferase subunit C
MSQTLTLCVTEVIHRLPSVTRTITSTPLYLLSASEGVVHAFPARWNARLALRYVPILQPRDRGRSMISEEQVRHVANLARLGLTDDEIAKMGTQLDAILDSIEKIRELDLADVPPTANPLNLSNVLRPDEPRPGLSQEEALAPAPERVDDLFAVPRID